MFRNLVNPGVGRTSGQHRDHDEEYNGQYEQQTQPRAPGGWPRPSHRVGLSPSYPVSRWLRSEAILTVPTFSSLRFVNGPLDSSEEAGGYLVEQGHVHGPFVITSEGRFQVFLASLAGGDPNPMFQTRTVITGS